MKKNLVVAAINREIIETYKIQLEEVLGDTIEISGYQFGVDKGILTGDLIVVSMQSTVQIARTYIEDQSIPVIWLHTTFLKKSVNQLKKIQTGTRVLLVSKFWYYVVESINLLKEMDITHIEMIPYFPEIEGTQINDIKTMVLMGFPMKRPEGVSQLIDIGWRVINPICFHKILNRLNLETNQVILRRLDTYRSKVMPVNTDRFIRASFDSETNSKIIDVLNALDQGILVIDTKNNIIAYNQSLCNLLDIKSKKYLKTNIEDIPILNDLVTHSRSSTLHTSIYFEQRLKKRFTVSRKDMIFQYQKYNDVIIVDEIQYSPSEMVKPIDKLNAKYLFENIIGKSSKLMKAIETAKKFAEIDAPVLIVGDTGTGKELFAHSIHNHSSRCRHPFIAINCASMPTTLLESELFGYESGSFTGALKKGKPGLFEIADGGTVFLDEIGDADLEFQVKLLRVLQEHEIIRIGGVTRKPINVRVISATNRDIKKLKAEGNFRNDLYYRLSSMILNLPDLAERKEDIPLLSRFFMDNIGGSNKTFDNKVMNFLESNNWEGNVRELKNCVEYLGYFGEETVELKDLPINYQEVSNKMNYNSRVECILESFTLEQKDAIRVILESLSLESGGRYKLLAALNEKGMQLNEYEVRKILIHLGTFQLIEKNIGRKGSQITDEGRLLLNYLETREKQEKYTCK
jgi:transcriptional regulator with PAS, ATPase and Fis domain